jgi:predicted nucleic acid-binding protein
LPGEFRIGVGASSTSMLDFRLYPPSFTAELVKTCSLRPSDALHVAAMRVNSVKVIASEDVDFDSVEGVQRVWAM